MERINKIIKNIPWLLNPIAIYQMIAEKKYEKGTTKLNGYRDFYEK